MVEQIIFYKKAITIQKQNDKFVILNHMGSNEHLELTSNEAQVLLKHYGKWDSDVNCYVIKGNLISYDAYELGVIDVNANVINYHIIFNEAEAYKELTSAMLKSSLTTTLGIGLDYDCLNAQAKNIFLNQDKVKSLILTVYKFMAIQLDLNNRHNYIIHLSKCKYPNNLLGAEIQEITNINLSNLTYTLIDTNKYCSYGYNYKHFNKH